jgi:hypothetical protein
MRFWAAAKWAKRATVALALLGLTGCELTDPFSVRTVAYNKEAEIGGDNQLLLNIIRAYKSLPMQFTTLQQVTGSAGSLSIAPTFSFGPGAKGKGDSIGITAGIQMGPGFQLAPLDTQSFYEGILTPIAPQLLDLYLNQGYPREFIFDLFVEKLVLVATPCVPETTPPENCVVTFTNDLGNPLQFELYQAVLDHLLRIGLSTKQVSLGPESSGRNSGSSRRSGGLDATGGNADVPTYGFCIEPTSEYRQDPQLYCLQVPQAAATGQDLLSATAPYLPSRLDRQISGLNLGCEDGKAGRAMVDRMTNALDEQTKREPKTELAVKRLRDRIGSLFQCAGGRAYQLHVYTRSPEGIIYYLGQMLRRILDADPDKHRAAVVTRYKFGPSYAPLPEVDCPTAPGLSEEARKIADGDGYVCTALFILDRASAPPPFFTPALTVTYDDSTYAVPTEGEERYNTLMVLSVLKQLIALSTNATALPASNILTVISPP